MQQETHVWDIIPSEQDKSKTLEFDSKTVAIGDQDVVIIDVPGHRNLVHEMIKGASSANIAIVVTSARSGELKDGVVSKQGNLGQIVEHCILLKAIGVQQVIIAVNKMDTTEWSKKVYKTVQKVVKKICKRYKLNIFTSIPLSAKDGVNVKTVDTETVPWYEGPSLIEALTELVSTTEQLVETVVESPVVKHKLKLTVLFVSNELVISGSRYILHLLQRDTEEETEAEKALRLRDTVECEIDKIRIETDDGVFVKKPFVKSSEEAPVKAQVKIVLDLPIRVGKSDRFIIRDSDKTIGIGFR